MGGVIKCTLVTRPVQLWKVEAGPISIITGANLVKPRKAAKPKYTEKGKESKNG